MASDRRAAQERLSALQQRMVALAGPPPAGAAADAAAAAAPPADALGLGAVLEGAAAAAGGVAAAAARAAVPSPPAAELRRVADAARRAGEGAFTWPLGAGVRVGQGVRLYYDRAAGPLPRDARPRVKAGLNNWEEVQMLEMRRAADLVDLEGQEWWEAEAQLPEELFK
jgi:hypothetical protein